MYICIHMLVLDLNDCKQAREKKGGIKKEGYRWQLLFAHGQKKKGFLLSASEKHYIFACVFKVEF